MLMLAAFVSEEDNIYPPTLASSLFFLFIRLKPSPLRQKALETKKLSYTDLWEDGP